MEKTLELCELPEIAVLLNLLHLSNEEAYEHSISVAFLVEDMLDLKRQCGANFSEEKKLEIIKGAILHDIGKAFLPLNLSQIPRVLTDTEYIVVQTHAVLSYEITKTVFSKIVQDICLYHHERANGSGYSKQITLDKIPEYVLIVQVADIYDALTRKRAYKQPYSQDEALRIMKKETDKLMLDDEYVNLLEETLKQNDICVTEDKNELSN